MGKEAAGTGEEKEIFSCLSGACSELKCLDDYGVGMVMRSSRFSLVSLCIIVTVLMLSSCATAKHFPPEDIVIAIPIPPSGRMYILIKKGNLNEEYKGKWWFTKREFLKYKDKLIKPLNGSI